jgi:hypothetical protein
VNSNVEYSKNDNTTVGKYCVVVLTKFRIDDDNVRGFRKAERYTQDNIIEWSSIPDKYGYVEDEFIIISDSKGKVLSLKEDKTLTPCQHKLIF